MNVLRSAIMAFSCFSAIPMPQVEWRDANMRYMMCFFPLVGVAIGLVLLGWTWLARLLAFGPVLYGAGLALLPVAVSGGIHLDGFCDVIDAQSSHASPQRKREILKDPHAGAFAAIAVAAYLLAYAAFASELQPAYHVALLVGLAHVASRCCSGIATVAFPLSAEHGMLAAFHKAGESRRVLIALLAELAACGVAMVALDAPAGAAMLAVALLCLAALRPFARSQFDGMSGDVAGFFLQVAELAMVIALVVAMKVVAL